MWALGYTSGPVADSSGPAPETLQSIHQSEVRLARRQFVWSALFLCLFAVVAVVFSPGRSMGSAFILGIGLFATIVAGLEWRKLARVDPLSLQYAPGGVPADNDDWRARDAERLVARPARITNGIIVTIILISAIQLFTGIRGSVEAAGLVKPATRGGDWWRLLTATYLHGSALHLIGNMAALRGAGRYVEAYAPRTRVLLVYLSAAVAGSIASLLLLPNTSSIGASGGIVGLFGYLLILARRRPHDVPPYLLTSALSTIGLAACIGLFGVAFIDNAGHAGGALAGIVVGLLTIPREGTPGPARATLLNRLGWVAGIVLVVGAMFTAQRLIAAEAGRRGRVAAQVAAEGMTPIRSVTARIVASTPSSTTVALQNLRDVPLEAWWIDVYAKVGDTQPVGSVVVDACCSGAITDALPIPPHGSRMLTFPRPARASALVASVRLVVFSDLAFEGSTRDRALLLRQREQAADRLASVLLGLQQGPERSTAATRQRIAEVEAQRAALLRHRATPTAVPLQAVPQTRSTSSPAPRPGAR